MIAVLGMLIIYAMQVRRQDILDSKEHRKNTIIEIYQRYADPELKYVSSTGKLPDILKLVPELYFKKIKKDAIESFSSRNQKNKEIYRERVEILKIDELKSELADIKELYSKVVYRKNGQCS